MAILDELMRMTRRLAEIDPREQVQPLCWRPAADVYRTGDGWLIKLELAGVAADAIRIAAAGHWLSVTGHRVDHTVVEGSRYYSLEIAYCRFERTIELPCRLDHAEIDSRYQDGMLWVTVMPGTHGS